MQEKGHVVVAASLTVTERRVNAAVLDKFGRCGPALGDKFVRLDPVALV